MRVWLDPALGDGAVIVVDDDELPLYTLADLNDELHPDHGYRSGARSP